MTELERSSRRTVEFAHPFTLDNGEGEMAPGRYDVETEEALIPGLSFIAYRRVRTTMVSPATTHGIALQRQVLTINPAALETALAKDAQMSLHAAKRGSAEHGASVHHSDEEAVGKVSPAVRHVDSSPLQPLQKNTLIARAPVFVPLLIVASLMLITWYRPGPQTVPPEGPPAASATTPAR